MLQEIIPDQIYIKKLNLNTEILKNSCDRVFTNMSQIDKSFFDCEFSSASSTAKLWKHYNLFTFPYEGLCELYEEIRKNFYENRLEKNNKKYYIQSWINYYLKGDYIDWHSHSNTHDRQFMSGYYCVYGEPSYTTFKTESNIEYHIVNKNDHMIFTKMGGQYTKLMHRTWPWDKDYPRISIAFEIVERERIPEFFAKEEMFNHWMPI
jgi:hypothetical protein